MSAVEVKNALVKAVSSQKYDFIVVNFANADMVGHTGNTEATAKAVEAVDQCIGEIMNVVLPLGGVLLITADHGNAEEVANLQTGEIDKEHSTNPVPFVVAGRGFENQAGGPVGRDLSLVSPVGILADVAPTILKIMGIPKPGEMTGTDLI
jgi:2,3-bisphosphoglycerate-independent phosphoglycerate mutase